MLRLLIKDITVEKLPVCLVLIDPPVPHGELRS
jgi:hypothetical protein